MALTGVWTTPVEHVDGELMTAAKVNAWQNNLLHLASRPDGASIVTQTGQTATSTTFTVLTSPAVTITPKVTGNMFIVGIITLSHSVNGGGSNIIVDVNGSTIATYATTIVTSASVMIPVIALVAVTANTSYTVKLGFNTFSGGTATAVNNYGAAIYAIEVG